MSFEAFLGYQVVDDDDDDDDELFLRNVWPTKGVKSYF